MKEVGLLKGEIDADHCQLNQPNTVSGLHSDSYRGSLGSVPFNSVLIQHMPDLGYFVHLSQSQAPAFPKLTTQCRNQDVYGQV
jgi:hypothetical protein